MFHYDFSTLADATAIGHFLIIVGIFVGLLLSFRYKRFRPFEAAVLILVGVLWSYYGNCPLAILEQWLREQAGETGVNITSVGFIPYYSQKLFGIGVTSRIVQQSTFFSGAVFFGASIEWLTPFFHHEVFKLRRLLRHVLGMKAKPRRRYA
jgi:hypothetical protein